MQHKILISLTGAVLASCLTNSAAFGGDIFSGDSSGATVQSSQKLPEKPQESGDDELFLAIAPKPENLQSVNPESNSRLAPSNNTANFSTVVATPNFIDSSLVPSSPTVNSGNLGGDSSGVEVAVNPYLTPEIIPNVAPAPPIRTAFQEGEASWYGPGFDGNYTASGEVFNRYGMTAAHPSLPFGTRLLVTNINTGRSIVVRVTDRGPFAGDRIIDLSQGAAQSIGMVDTGVADVRLDIIQP